jgi:hypothetical protein
VALLLEQISDRRMPDQIPFRETVRRKPFEDFAVEDFAVKDLAIVTWPVWQSRHFRRMDRNDF